MPRVFRHSLASKAIYDIKATWNPSYDAIAYPCNPV